MSRCGCSAGACSCIIQAGPGTTVTGNGSLGTPYVPAVKLSRDAGNCLRFGSDLGVYTPCSDETGQDICGISVGNLPEEHVVFGRGGAGRLLAPDHTLASFQRAVELGLDGTHAHVRELGDGTPVCYPSSTMTNQTSIEGLRLDQIGVSYYKQVPIRAGWNSSVTGNLGDRHGFFGFQEPDKVGGVTLSEVLSTVGRRSVLLLQMLGTYSASFPEKVISLIYRYCAHEAVIVASSNIDDLEVFTQAQIPTCFLAETTDAATENPPSLLTERGVEWFAGRLHDVTVDQFVGYSTAGIQVLGFMANRHYEWGLLDEIGARGCISDDALYMTMDPARYRSPTMSETLQYPQVQPGLLGYWTDARRDLPEGPGQPGEVYWPHQGRGFYYPQNVPGVTAAHAFYMPGRGPSSQPEPSGTPYRTPSGVFDVLTGFINPIPNPEEYTIRVDASFRDTPGINRPIGFVLGRADDRAFDDLGTDHPYWACGIRWDGSLFCERWENGSIQSSAYADSSQLAEDVFYRLQVVVMPESVTVQRLDGTAVVAEAVVEDSNTRGPYTFLFKNERAASTGTWYPFGAAWRNLVVTGPGINAMRQAGPRVRMTAAAEQDEEARNTANP